MKELISFQVGMWFMALVIWTLVWKGLAMWKAARLRQQWWFVAFFIVNTGGILEILYIFVISKPKGLKNL